MSEDESKFNELLSAWGESTLLSSYLTEKIFDLNYQMIIGMGEKALPFIFKRLREYIEEPWMYALVCITGKTLPSNNRDESIEKWLSWGRENGYC